MRDLGSIEKEVRTHGNGWHTMRVLPYRTLSNKIDGVVITFNNVSRLKQTERALRTIRDKLQKEVDRKSERLTKTHAALETEVGRREELSRRFARLQDEERQRIARELHDTTAQNLAGLGINLALIEKASKQMPSNVRKVVSDSTELIYAVMREIRTVSYLLHPPLLAEAGVWSAIRSYIEGFSKRSGIRVRFVLSKGLGTLPLGAKSAVFRMIQECLTNIHRHSGSEKASIRVRRDRQHLTVQVEDGGRGFPAGIIGPGGEILFCKHAAFVSSHARRSMIKYCVSPGNDHERYRDANSRGR